MGFNKLVCLIAASVRFFQMVLKKFIVYPHNSGAILKKIFGVLCRYRIL